MAHHWISVNEALPEESGLYLIVSGGHHVVTNYSAEHRMFNVYDAFKQEEADSLRMECSYWMPLPPIPRKGL